MAELANRALAGSARFIQVPVADRDPRPEADLEHAVVALDIEQRDHPGIASAV